MLLIVRIDDTIEEIDALKEFMKPGDVVRWLVNEQLPFTHVQQLEALLKALNEKLERLPDLQLAAMHLKCDIVLDGDSTSDPLDWHKSALMLNLKGGMTLRIRKKLPPTRMARAMTRNTSHAMSSSAEGLTLTNMTDVDDHQAGAGDGSDGEDYLAETCGWFPFIYDRGYDAAAVVANAGPPTAGGSSNTLTRQASSYMTTGKTYDSKIEGEILSVNFTNPDEEPHPEDFKPRSNALCDQCCVIVKRTTQLRVPVGKHYKPMMMHTDFAEGTVEKLSGSTLPRWVSRYLNISEKSVDWYTQMPKVGVKTKTKGSRMIYDGARILLKEILENVDPKVHTKCADPKFFHFGTVFTELDGKETTLLFRVGSAEMKSRFVSFLRSVLARAGNKGASKDPRFWKGKADSLLTSIADTSEYGADLVQEEEEMAQECALLERQLLDMRAEKPKVQAELEIEREKVTSSTSTLDGLKLKRKVTSDKLTALADEVTSADINFRNAKQDNSEELSGYQVRILRAEQQRDELHREIEILKAEADEFTEKQHAYFARWRKADESHNKNLESRKGKLFSFSMDPPPEVFNGEEFMGMPRSPSAMSGFRGRSPVHTPRTPRTPRTGRAPSASVSTAGSPAPTPRRAVTPRSTTPATAPRATGGTGLTVVNLDYENSVVSRSASQYSATSQGAMTPRRTGYAGPSTPRRTVGDATTPSRSRTPLRTLASALASPAPSDAEFLKKRNNFAYLL